MARRVFLHLGTAKSGTSYLQDLWWRHHDALREQGLLLPGDSRREHFTAAAVVKQMTSILDTLTPRERTAWPRILKESAAWDGDVLISNEHFSDTPAEAAHAALDSLGAVAEEVHLILTARDLGRVLPSAWQQRVKMGARQPYRRFLGSVRHGEEAQKFWRYQDVGAILALWSADGPPEHVHLVVVPPPGAPRDALWRATAGVVGLDVTGLDTRAERPNDSLGVIEAELLRRLNERLPRADRSPVLTRRIKGWFVPEVLAGAAGTPVGFVLPEQHRGWVLERSEAMVADLRARAYDVRGDLRDLISAGSPQGRTPGEVTDEELLAAAGVVLERLGAGPAGTLEAALDVLAEAAPAAMGQAQRGMSAQ